MLSNNTTPEASELNQDLLISDQIVCLLKVLLSSGYSIDGQATEILKRGCDAFLQKPFNMGQLSKSVPSLSKLITAIKIEY